MMTRAAPPRPFTSSAYVTLAIVLAVAAGLRLVNHFQIKDGPLQRLHHWAQSDMHFYNNWARQIVAGDFLTDREMHPYHSWHDRMAREVHDSAGGTPFDESVGRRIWNRWLGQKRFYEDPLYPYLLASLYAVFGYDVRAALLAQMLLGMGCVALVYCLALLLFDVSVASVAGSVAALFGPLIMYEGVLLRCVMLTFTGLATLYVVIIASERPQRSRWFFLAGVLFGVTFLLKSSTVLFAAAALTLAGIRLRHDGPQLRRSIGMAILGFAIAVSPLVTRNLMVGVAPLSFASSGPVTFLNHNAEDYVPEGGDYLSVHAATIMQRTDGAWVPAIRETLSTHDGPGSWLRLLWRKLLAFWHWYEVPNNTSYYYFRLHASAVSAVAADYYMIAPIAVVGLLLGAGRSYAHTFAALYIACGIAGILMFFNLARFRVPIACALMPFAAFGMLSLLRLVRRRRFRVATVWVSVVAALTTAVLRPLPAGIGARLRTADFGVANEIAAHYVRQHLSEGRLDEAMRLLERQLETEPAELRAVEPGPGETRISVLSASVAGSFADLYEIGATLNAQLERFQRAAEHSRRAQVLRTIESRFDLRGGRDEEGRVQPAEPPASPAPIRE